MGRWRSKLLLSLIVYAAGFATAIYVLSPPQATETKPGETKATTISQWAPNAETQQAGFDATPWIETAQAAIGKAAGFAKAQSVILADVIKAKVEQNKRDRGD